MATVTVYGVSDDLVEIEGDIVEEFNPLADEPGLLLAFGDGTVLGVAYDSFGVWRINVGAEGTAEIVKDTDPGDDENRYSDRVTLTGDLRWVVAADPLAFHRVKEATP